MSSQGICMPGTQPPSSGTPAALLKAAARAGDSSQVVERAYAAAASWHHGQLRLSGDPYITHPVAVALIAAEFDPRPSPPVLCAALLHDVLADTPCKLTQLRSEFGDEIADLVDQVTRLDRGRYRTLLDRGRYRTLLDRGRYRTILEAMAAAQSVEDHRVLIIKVADRLHNMRTLGYLQPEKQRRKSGEVLDFFAPLARTLGMDEIEREFVNLASAVLTRPDCSPAPSTRPGQIRFPILSRRLLAATLILLPVPARERWLEEWTGELSTLPTHRSRARFTMEMLTGMPRLAVTLRLPDPR